MINRMINKKRRDITLNYIYPIPSENPNNKFYKLNYVKGISNKIIDILKKYNIRITYINTNNIGKILTNKKDKTDKFSKVVSIASIVTNVMLSIMVKLEKFRNTGYRTF